MPNAKNIVIKITNIDMEDFSWSFNSMPWTLKSGESQYFPAAMARLFAKHLAQKILRRAKKSSPEGKMDGAILFPEEGVKQLTEKILGGQVDVPKEVEAPAEAFKRQVLDINEKLNINVTPEVAVTTKAEIIAKLQEKGVKVQVTKSKEELLAQLKELK